MKYNLGAGDIELPGYIAIDKKGGSEAFPLDIADESAEEIRASHILEHFPHGRVPFVLGHWVRKLKPGGVLKIAVPDLEWIAKNYLAGRDFNVQGYLMGGQVDSLDFHFSSFDEELLAELLREAGLVDIARWSSELADCAALPVSLNLQGTKPPTRVMSEPLKVIAVMSSPRLGFDDNFLCAFRHLPSRGIDIRKFKGAFWEQCIERAIEQSLEQGADAVLTIDYDTVFTGADIDALLLLLREHPEADAIAPLQSARWRPEPLLTMDLPLGVKSADRMPPGVFAQPLTRLKTAHFGCTLIRSSALKKLQKPWFWSQPDKAGSWGPERRDADSTFWDRFAAAGRALYSANRVAVGHLELMVLWPGKDFAVVTQPVSDFMENGKPGVIWS